VGSAEAGRPACRHWRARITNSKTSQAVTAAAAPRSATRRARASSSPSVAIRGKIAATGQAGHHQRAAGVIAVQAQVGRRGILAGVQVGQPADALAQPARLIDQPVADQAAAVKPGVVVPAGIFGRGPARVEPPEAERGRGLDEAPRGSPQRGRA
jgi:hypothetical protein